MHGYYSIQNHKTVLYVLPVYTVYIVHVLTGYNKIKTISKSQQALINGQLTIKDHSTAS